MSRKLRIEEPCGRGEREIVEIVECHDGKLVISTFTEAAGGRCVTSMPPRVLLSKEAKQNLAAFLSVGDARKDGA